MRSIVLSISDEEDELIRKCAERYHIDVSSFIRQAIRERIEEDQDLALLNQVLAEEEGQDRISHEQVKRELGL